MFCFNLYLTHLYLHSFPTRRSSDLEGSQLIIPAKLTKSETKKVQELAIAGFRAVDCSGLARVDFLMDPKSRKIFLNEINTMPGDRKSTRLNSSHQIISYAVFCLKKK